ncbi:MAG: alginate export family protein [Candidatus Omnitrophota bacterium]
MKKHLILLLALALVAGSAFAAYAEVQNVKVSGDITALALGRALSLTSQKAETTMASIIRLRVDADLTDNVTATVRLINERYWGEDVTNQNTTGYGSSATSDNTNIDLDLAYVTLKEFLYSPLTLTVGRQELHFGSDMIVGDAYTNNHASKASVFNTTIDKDLSMRKSFDSIRATLNYDPLVVDVVAAQVRKNSRTLTYNLSSGSSALDIDTQETLIGVNANYAVNKDTNVEGYFWQRRIGKNDKSASGVLKTDTTNVVGARLVAKPIENLTYELESAFQFGKSTSSSANLERKAWALETMATYDLKNVKNMAKYVPTVSALYAYFSGDRGSKSGTETYKGWDPMYENQTFGSIANAIFNQTNMHIIGGIIQAKATDDVTLKAEYYAYWWDKRHSDGDTVSNVATGLPATMTGKKFLGQEIDLSATYDYTEDVQFGILAGWLAPGKSFAKVNRNTAAEVIGSMKVTF